MGLTLASEFSALGHEVKVITETTECDDARFPFEIILKPSPVQLLALVRWCEVFFHNNISLRVAWPLLIVRRPWVVAHHAWIERVGGGIGVRDRLKQIVLRRARNIAVSKALSEGISAPVTIIGNPYRDDVDV